MIAIIKRAIGPFVIALTATCSTAFASSGATGLWYDHTGRGAVEVTDCNGKLCGRLVWVKDPNHNEGCGFQIFGDVKPVSNGKWDGGWIIDPEKDPNTKYDVEITLQGDKLKVMGYAGMKFLSQTMMWTRAPADLKRCSETTARAPEPAPAPAPAPASPPKRADGEPPTVYPPPAATPAPAPPPPPAAANPDPPKPAQREAPTAAAKPGKDCKIEFGGISLTFPCAD
jgi:uncharacterized protein (DUF2147 family)